MFAVATVATVATFEANNGKGGNTNNTICELAKETEKHAEGLTAVKNKGNSVIEFYKTFNIIKIMLMVIDGDEKAGEAEKRNDIRRNDQKSAFEEEWHEALDHTCMDVTKGVQLGSKHIRL